MYICTCIYIYIYIYIRDIHAPVYVKSFVEKPGLAALEGMRVSPAWGILVCVDYRSFCAGCTCMLSSRAFISSLRLLKTHGHVGTESKQTDYCGRLRKRRCMHMGLLSLTAGTFRPYATWRVCTRMSAPRRLIAWNRNIPPSTACFM